MLARIDQPALPAPLLAPTHGPVCFIGGDVDSDALRFARALVDNTRSPATLDKYERNWALFVKWVRDRYPERPAFPAHPALVGTFIGDLGARGRSKTTILNYIAAIVYAHELGGFPSPIEPIREVLPDGSARMDNTLAREVRGLRRLDSGDRQARLALEMELATQVAGTIPTDTLQGRRDRAIFCFTFLTALRRSNVAAMRVRDVRLEYDQLRETRYLSVQIRRSKTDQEGVGRSMAVTEVPYASPLCAVRAIEAWLADLAAAGRVDPDAPLFPTFSRKCSIGYGAISAVAIDGKDVSRVVKRVCLGAKIPEAKLFAAHSLRRGFATSAIRKGVRKSLVREHGGWKTDAMLDRYTVIDKARDNAVAELFK